MQNINLAQGLSLERMQDRRSLARTFDSHRRNLDSIGTARAQLKAVLSKTQTHRQAELVALLLRLAMIG